MTEYLDRYPTMHEYAEGKRIDPKLTDYISRADAIEAVRSAISEEWLLREAIVTDIKALPSAEAEQVTSKLKNPCDSLLTEESNDSKEQKSKLEHDREWIIGCIKHDGFIKTHRFDKANQIILEALSAEATKKKAELKDDGDWDCPDVYCDECDHHRSVEWCSLAIPSHEEIDDTYKMVNEAFFEGFDAAEKRYRFLIETVEELDKKLAEYEDYEHATLVDIKEPLKVAVVRCKDCRHAMIRTEDEMNKPIKPQPILCEWFCIGVENDDYCSHGERREP